MQKYGIDRYFPAHDEKILFCVRRVYLNTQGYDSSGRYWGAGSPLFWAFSDDEHCVEMHMRAFSRDGAIDSVLRKYPNAIFRRGKSADCPG